MTDDDPADEREPPAGGPGETDGDPFEELPDRDDPGTDPFEELFGEVDPDGEDPEAAWEELRERSATGERDPHGGIDAVAGSDADLHTVPKRSFCEDCRHLSTPPEFSCTHDGTEIVEFVDRHHVRVRDCPVVRERRELEDGGGRAG